MKFKLNLDDYNRQIRAMTSRILRTDKDLVSKAHAIITVLTDKLMEESIRRAPIDESFLEKSHVKKIIKSFVASKIHGHVFIPSNAPASDYAMFMHELNYKLGKRSIEKQKANPEIIVGRKYLERALSENERAFSLYIIKELKEFIGD